MPLIHHHTSGYSYIVELQRLVEAFNPIPVGSGGGIIRLFGEPGQLHRFPTVEGCERWSARKE